MEDLRIVGFNFSKLNVEKNSSDFKNLKIDRNISVDSVESVKKSSIQIKDELMEIKFTYKIKYSPDVANFEFSGSLLATADSKVTKEFLKEWKNKKFPEKYRILIFNIIMRKSDIKALALEDELGLPLHITLPLIREEQK